MVNYYALHWLKPSEWAQAYPLVRMVHPHWSLAHWHKRARILARSKARPPGTTHPDGLIAVQDRRGIIHGLLVCRLEQDLTGAKYIRISDVMLARLPGTQLDEAILDGLVHICTEYHCSGLLLDMPASGGNGLSQNVLDKYHFAPCGIIYSRTAAPSPQAQI